MTNITMSSELGKMVIKGCIAKIDKASTGAPCGSDGKLVVFTSESIKKCADSFVGMPLDCTYPDGFFADGTDLFTGHGETNIGYIRSVEAKDNNLMAEMVIWKDKFPEEAFMIVNGADSLGFSAEWYPTNTHEDDTTIFMDEFQGAGCAILWKNCAAFSDTFIETLAASMEKKNRSDKKMNEQEKKEIIDSIMAGLDEKLKDYEKKIEEIKASVDNVKGEVEESVKASIEEIKADVEKAKDTVEASKEVPAPETQKIAPNPFEANKEETKEDKIEKINASDMSLAEKLRAITKIRYGK